MHDLLINRSPFVLCITTTMLTWSSPHLALAAALFLPLVKGLSIGWGVTNKLPLPTVDLGRPATRCSVNIGGKVAVGQVVDGGCRYTVRYGEAARWGASVTSSSFGYVIVNPRAPIVH